MINSSIANADFEDTGFSYTLSLISGKYKMVILYCLMEYKVVRFNELQRLLGNITTKTLTQQLRELEEQGIVLRNVFPEVPPRVEYSLSEIGITLKPILKGLCEWGKTYQQKKYDLEVLQ